MVLLADLMPGDVILTRNEKSRAAWWIRFGAALRGRPNTVNHGLIVHHRNPDGRVIAYEGRPGGFGIVEVTQKMLDRPFTMTNVEQPKDEAGRFLAAKAAEDLLGIPYDWEGILFAGFASIGVDLDDGSFGEGLPGHVFCTNALDWIYDTVGWASPGRKFDRAVTPAHWADFITRRGWMPVA